MKITIASKLPEFQRRHAVKMKRVMRNHWAACKALITKPLISQAVEIEMLPGELVDAIKQQHRELASLGIRPTMATLLTKAGNEIMAEIERHKKGLVAWIVAARSMETKEFNPLTDRVISFINNEAQYFEVEFSAEMVASLQRVLTAAAQDGWSTYTISNSLSEFVGLTTKQAATVARGMTAKMASLAEAGMSPRDVASEGAEFAKRYGEWMRRVRVETIARTETGRAYGCGQQEAVRQAIDSGIAKGAKKTWRHSGLDNARAAHEAMDGESIPLNETFSNGEEYPGMINCRCTVEYEIEV